jgi:O-antigen ligase
MAFPAIAAASVIVAAFLGHVGSDFDRLLDFRQFKLASFRDGGIALNPLSFVAASSLLIYLPATTSRPMRRYLALALVAAALLVSSSRASQLSFAAALVAVPALDVLLRFRPATRLAATVAVVATTGLVGATVIRSVMRSMTTDALYDFTAGRAQLWAVAWSSFRANPLLGAGPGSWRESVAAISNVGDVVRTQQILDLSSGGYHSAYVGLLAERGLLGFVSGFLLLAFLGVLSVRLHAHHDALSGSDRTFAYLAPAIWTLFAVRGLFEQPGLFGYGDGLVDFLAFSFAACTVALAGTIHADCRPGSAK